MLGSVQTMEDKPHHDRVLFWELQVQRSEMQHETADQLTLTLEVFSSVTNITIALFFPSWGVVRSYSLGYD